MLAESGTTWSCPNCGATMKKLTSESLSSYICPECGCAVEEIEQNFSLGRDCPNCHQVVDTNNECPRCGYDLGSDFD